MLEIIYYNGSEEEESLLSSFDPQRHTLICTSLRIKKQIQFKKIAEKEWLPGSAVQRAREFWQKLYLDSAPADTPLSTELCSVLFTSFMASRADLKEQWPSAEGLENQVIPYLEQLLPLFSHPNCDEILSTWTEETELSDNKLRFVHLCRAFYEDLRSQGRFFSSWCPHLLSQMDGWWDRLPEQLYFHLHAELGLQEAELIGTMSRYREVKVLAPSPPWQQKYPKLFRGYKVLTTFKHSVVQNAGEHHHVAPFAERFSSTLSECKEVVAKVRQALEQNIPPQQILIMAPRIEDYWPELFPLLQAEGIPVAKSLVHRLHGFFDIQVFLSRLRNAIKKFRLEDAELGAYGKDSPPEKFSKFQEASNILLEWSDLSRLDFENHVVLGEPAPDEEMGRQEFLDWFLSHWPAGWSLERLELLVARYLQETPPKMKFRAPQGVRYLESLAAQIEVPSYAADPAGVQLDNLGGGLLGPYSHVFCLGLAQESFDSSENFLLSPPEVSLLERSFGLNLEEAHFEYSDFCLEWVCERKKADIFFGYSEVDMSSRVLSPSWPWLKHFRGEGSTVPAMTQWQWACTQPLDERIGASFFVERDLGLKSAATPLKRSEVSASGLEDYLRCPFIYLIKRGFRFSDRPDLDMDISALDRGSLVHKMLELLISDLQKGVGEPDFEAVLHQAQQDIGFVPVESDFWLHQRRNLLDLAKRFWALEQNHRQKLPKSTTLGLEVAVEGHFDITTGQFSREPTENSVPWSGRIDRLDGHDEEVVLYDYKSTANGITSASSWLEKGRLQMLAYALAVEAGLTELGRKNVVGAYYYPLKPLGDFRGFQLDGHSGEVVELKKGFKKDEWDEVKAQTLNLIQNLIENIRAGKFDPAPKDKEDCPSCVWRTQCRAPHLS